MMELVNGIRNETRVLPYAPLECGQKQGTTARLWIHSAEHIEEIDSDLRRQLDSNHCSNAYPALISRHANRIPGLLVFAERQ
jgi:hypothetical protein